MNKTKFEVNYRSEEINQLVSRCEHKTLALWASDCAEHVLIYFEGKHPDNSNPREAIEAVRLWVRDEMKMTDARKAAFASHTAAREASEDTAIATARACGHAAATAHVATHAPHAATYAAKAVGYDKKDMNAERDWQYNRLLELYSESKHCIP